MIRPRPKTVEKHSPNVYSATDSTSSHSFKSTDGLQTAFHCPLHMREPNTSGPLCKSILALICLSVSIERAICHPVAFWLPWDVWRCGKALIEPAGRLGVNWRESPAVLAAIIRDRTSKRGVCARPGCHQNPAPLDLPTLAGRKQNHLIRRQILFIFFLVLCACLLVHTSPSLQSGDYSKQEV